MKYLILILFCQFSFADQIFRDKNGFVSCFEKDDQVYFLEWDHLTQAQEKPVFYFEIKDYVRASNHFIQSCGDQKYIHDIPNEILQPMRGSDLPFPSEILFSAQQINEGGRIFRSEKTATEFINKNLKLFQIDSPTQIEILRKKHGDKFTETVISEWGQNLFSKNQSCEKYIGTCDFYLCQEQKNPCGINGYNLDFGFKYCSGSKFALFNQMQTDLGKSWVTNVFQCLQRQSLKATDAKAVRTCEQIKSDAYDSHPDCYAEAGFCELKFSEKLKIFKLIKKEIFSTATIQQGQQLLHKCHLEKQEQNLLNNELI